MSFHFKKRSVLTIKISEISGETRLAGFIADPAQHSYSPRMHNLAFQLTQTDAIYLAFTVKKEDLKEAIQSIRSLNMLGVNISMPHKIAAMNYVDELSKSARLIGAINTIENKAGRLIGHNTDGIGFMSSLAAEKVPFKEKTFTVLGAGGASNAIICQAAIEGVKKINVFSRKGKNYDNMQAKISHIQTSTGCRVYLYEFLDSKQLNCCLLESDLLVNCTSIGMNDNQTPLANFEAISAQLVVCDIIYKPEETALLKKAKARGATTFNGIGMLLYQGAAAFEIWTGKQMPLQEIYSVLKKTI